MILPIIMSLALASTAEMEPSRSFCAFPSGSSGADMLQVSLEADRARPRSRLVWLEVGAHRIRGRSMQLKAGELSGAASLVILSEEIAGELTIRLSADGSAVLVILPEGRDTPIKREGRCGGVSSLMAALSPR
ncbi:MAG: hypothetical protein V2I65_04485 [Paracoccaceae bacterium]|jgi:hypothetical protein|nr:hypothetical protein [Paracoccaceae bacterium]